MSDFELQALDKSDKINKALVERGEALERLRSNRDFKKLILAGYFEEEAVRLVHLKSDMNMQTPDAQRAILGQIDAIGMLRSYLDAVMFSANRAKANLEENAETRAELEEELANV